MDNLLKRIVQKELENHGEPLELLEKIRGKEEPINNAIKKEKRVHIKWKQKDPIKEMDTTVSLKNGGKAPFSFM